MSAERIKKEMNEMKKGSADWRMTGEMSSSSASSFASSSGSSVVETGRVYNDTGARRKNAASNDTGASDESVTVLENVADDSNLTINKAPTKIAITNEFLDEMQEKLSQSHQSNMDLLSQNNILKSEVSMI